MTTAAGSDTIPHRRRLMALLAAGAAVGAGAARAATLLAPSHARLIAAPTIRLTSADSIADYLGRDPEARATVLGRFAAPSSCKG